MPYIMEKGAKNGWDLLKIQLYMDNKRQCAMTPNQFLPARKSVGGELAGIELHLETFLGLLWVTGSSY